jgi:hypothetical protein
VAVAIVAARDAELGFLARWRGPIAAAASVSFSMYLMHYPPVRGVRFGVSGE